MKKFTIALLLILALAVGVLAACGAETGPEGRYTLKTINGASPDVEFTIELKAGGEAQVVNGLGELSGTWTQEGDVITVTVQGDPVDFTLQGNTLTTEESGMRFVFEKD